MRMSVKFLEFCNLDPHRYQKALACSSILLNILCIDVLENTQSELRWTKSFRRNRFGDYELFHVDVNLVESTYSA